MDLTKLKVGAQCMAHMKVETADTALAVGSGSLEVLATPRLIALMENAAMNAVAPMLPEGVTTVGLRMDMHHARPSALGAEVTATATLKEIDGKRFTFSVEAVMGDVLVGEALHVRAAVDGAKFMDRLAGK